MAPPLTPGDNKPTPKQMEQAQKNADGQRPYTMRFRVTADERTDLLAKAAAAGLSYSDYIRSKVTGSKPVTKKATPEREAIIRLMAALGKSGSNLNQMARVLHRKADDAEGIKNTLIMVEYAVNDHRTILGHLNKLLEDGYQG